MTSPNFEPFLSCTLVETTSTKTFKDLPVGALFANTNGLAFVKISELEAVNLYHQHIVNFGPREYDDFDGKKFIVNDLDTPVLLLKFYA
jgi:hypothetical protein